MTPMINVNKAAVAVATLDHVRFASDGERDAVTVGRLALAALNDPNAAEHLQRHHVYPGVLLSALEDYVAKLPAERIEGPVIQSRPQLDDLSATLLALVKDGKEAEAVSLLKRSDLSDFPLGGWNERMMLSGSVAAAIDERGGDSASFALMRDGPMILSG